MTFTYYLLFLHNCENLDLYIYIYMIPLTGRIRWEKSGRSHKNETRANI